MGKVTIEQALVAARQPQGSLSGFTSQTMRQVQMQDTYTLFKQAARRRYIPLFGGIGKLSVASLVALIIAALAITTGTAYALFQWWQQPQASVQSVEQNQHGRQEAVLDLKNCTGSDTNALTFEVKKGHNVSAEELAKIVEARCERNQIDYWAREKWHSPQAYTNHSAPMTLQAVTAQKLVTVTPDGPHDVNLHPNILFIASGVTVTAADIKPGDSVIYIERVTYEHDLNNVTAYDIVAVIKLNQPLEYYTDKQHLITTRHACRGVQHETCVNAPAMSIRGPNPYPIPSETAQAVLEGRLISHSAHHLELRASSGTIYTIGTPTDVIAEYNAKTAPTRGIDVTIGDMLIISYFYYSHEGSTKSRAELLGDVMLVLDIEQELDPFHKY